MFEVKLQKFSRPVIHHVTGKIYRLTNPGFILVGCNSFSVEKREPDLCQVGELQKIFIFVSH